MYSEKDLELRDIQSLELGYPRIKPIIPKTVYEARKERLIQRMTEKKLEAVVIYADREHYANFKYFTGREPRFEEVMLVIHVNGDTYCALGNECYSLAQCSGIQMQAVFCQLFSLPNQPMDEFSSFQQVLLDCGLKAGMRLGLVDWKLLQRGDDTYEDKLYFMPSYLLNTIRDLIGEEALLTNETPMLIAPADGLRIWAEADAIAEFEFGATVASQNVIEMLDHVKPGMSELELANYMQGCGQIPNCHELVLSGDNCRKGLVAPGNDVLALGTPFTASTGYEGGLTCRTALLAYDAQDTEDGEYYLENIVKPYMAAVFNWYEMIGIGVSCGKMFDMVQNCIPKEKFGWMLNPGHMIGYEEWMCSPMYRGSEVCVQSGMIFQMDIIPSDPKYPGVNAEDGIAIADAQLRAEIEHKYPDTYARIMARREFAEKQIGISLKPEVLPLSNCFAEFRPFALRRENAVVVKRSCK